MDVTALLKVEMENGDAPLWDRDNKRVEKIPKKKKETLSFASQEPSALHTRKTWSFVPCAPLAFKGS